MKSLFSFLLAALAFNGYGQDSIDHLFNNYQNGEEFCRIHQEITAPEKGFRVKVPINYQMPESGQTTIFAFWSEGKFDPKLPTVLTFDGGPGGNSHGRPVMLKQFNQLHFDQRGIACSRPSTVEIYRSPNFYSSLNTARDALAIVNHLGINQVSIFGGSYGTLPATIFAHLYPGHVKAMVLEGTVFDKNSMLVDLMTNEMKKVYQRLPETSQEAMKTFFSNSDKATQLFEYVQNLGYEDNAFDKLERTLLSLFPGDGKIDIEKAEETFSDSEEEQTDSLDNEDEFTNYAIHCQEFVRHGLQVPLFFKAPEGEYLFYPYPVDDKADCNAKGIMENAVPYQADRYPLTVPVTYFHGSWDLASAVTGAVAHYELAAKAKAQLLIAERGGHMPNYLPMSELGESKESRLHQQMLLHGLMGETISNSTIGQLNSVQNRVTWSLTVK